MTDADFLAFKNANTKIEELNKDYQEKVKPHKEIYWSFLDEVENWFGLFLENDDKLPEAVKNLHFGSGYEDVDLDKDKFVFKVGEYEYEGDYTQYFRCEVPLDEIVDVLNNKKSLWDYNPDIKIHYM